MKKGKEKMGISLIVLVITIIVIIILVVAVILTLNNNNPIEKANQARYESDVANMQAIFTNVVTKIMAQNQCTIGVNAGSLNSIKTVENGVNTTEGRVNYTLNNPQDSSNKDGIIIFNTGTNNNTTYYTGRKLPLYSSGETIWYVDSEGVISLKIDDKEYGKGKMEDKPAGEETEITITKTGTPMMKHIMLRQFDLLPNYNVITKIKFITSDKVSKDKEKLSDISEAQDKSVMAWVEDNKKTLIIASREKIIANPDSSNMFYDLNSLTNIENLNLLDTSQVTNMQSMFSSCDKLNQIDLRSFNTENVTNMTGMFGHSSFTSLDLRSFNTSNVTNMIEMFWYSKVESLDLSSFNTSSVTNMQNMFYSCNRLTNLDLGSFNTENVTNMNKMFAYSTVLKNLNFGNSFYTKDSCDLVGMFENCINLTTTIAIKNNNIKYNGIFKSAATSSNSQITVNYTSETSDLVDSMIATKDSASNIVKGTLIN